MMNEVSTCIYFKDGAGLCEGGLPCNIKRCTTNKSALYKYKPNPHKLNVFLLDRFVEALTEPLRDPSWDYEKKCLKEDY